MVFKRRELAKKSFIRAYTLVREHFKPIRNAALGQKMRIMKPI
jgi:hypothetical protein